METKKPNKNSVKTRMVPEYWVLLGFTGFYWVLLGFTGLAGYYFVFKILSSVPQKSNYSDQ